MVRKRWTTGRGRGAASGGGGGDAVVGAVVGAVQRLVQRLVQTSHLDGPVGRGLCLHLAQRDVGVGGRLQRGSTDGWTGWAGGS